MLNIPRPSLAQQSRIYSDPSFSAAHRPKQVRPPLSTLTDYWKGFEHKISLDSVQVLVGPSWSYGYVKLQMPSGILYL